MVEVVLASCCLALCILLFRQSRLIRRKERLRRRLLREHLRKDSYFQEQLAFFGHCYGVHQELWKHADNHPNLSEDKQLLLRELGNALTIPLEKIYFETHISCGNASFREEIEKENWTILPLLEKIDDPVIGELWREGSLSALCQIINRLFLEIFEQEQSEENDR